MGLGCARVWLWGWDSQIRLRDTKMPSAREVLLFVRTQGPRVVTTRPGCSAAACTAPAPVLHQLHDPISSHTAVSFHPGAPEPAPASPPAGPGARASATPPRPRLQPVPAHAPSSTAPWPRPAGHAPCRPRPCRQRPCRQRLSRQRHSSSIPNIASTVSN